MSDILLSVDGDTRPLESKLNRISSKSINFNLKDGISQPLGRITGKVSEFDKSLEASNARVLAFGASAGAVYALGRAFKEMVSSTIEVEKSLADINVVLNASSSQLNQFSSGLFNVAKNTGQSFSEVAKAATELARQGLGIEETLKRTSDALILTRLSGLGAAQSVETLTAAVNGFSKAGLTTSEVLNKLSTVDQAFAVSSADLANALSRVGSTAQDVGVGIDELIAIVTAAQQTTARGGAVIGNSLKTIFTRLQRTDTLQELENLGIAVKDVAGNTLPAVQILKNLSNVFYQLGDAQRASVAETVGGVFQINILRAALGDLSKEFSIYDSALRTSATATDQAIQKNEALNQTLSALINKTLANLTQSGAKVGEITITPTLKGGLNVLNKALEGFNQPTEAQGVGTKIGTGILEGIGSYLSGPGVAVISAVFLKIFGRLTSFSAEALKGLLGISSQTDLIGQAQAKVNAILAQNPALVEAIITKQASLLQIENQILKIIQAQNTARSAAATISASVVPKVVKGVGPSKTKAFGFVPNFSPEMQEIMGAQQGGYQAGNIKRMNIPGEGRVIYNSAESVVNFPGASQPAIIPPENSIAGKNYRKQFEKEAGFDPYAASGFVPNFAEKDRKYIQIQDPSAKSKARGSKKNEIPIEKQNKVGMIIPFKSGGWSTTYGEAVFGDYKVKIGFPIAGYNPSKVRKPADVDLAKQLGDNLVRFTNNFAQKLFTGGNQSNIKISSINDISNAGSFGSIVGTVFETAVGLATQNMQEGRGANAPIDFDPANEKLKALFNNMPAQGYEAKVNGSQPQKDSTAQKILDLGYLDDKIKRKLGKEYAERTASKRYQYLQGKSRYTKLTNEEKREFQGLYRTEKDRRSKSSGFIPNFSALQDAINREKEAGVASSKIRVGSDQSLISRENPYGLGVYNTKDEPGGLKQGIDRAKSKGYIPNYAQKPESQTTKEDGFDKFQSKLLAASIALQLASGVTNQFTDKTSESSKTFNDLINSVSNAASAFAIGGIFGKTAGKFVAPALALGMGTIQYSGMQQEKENAPYISQIQKLEEKLNSLKESGSQLESVLSKTGVVLNNYSTELENAVPDQTKIQDFRKQFLEAISDLPTELRSSLLEIFKNQPILDKQTPSLLMGPLNQAQAQNQREQGMSTLQQNLTRERQKQNQVINNQSGFIASLRNSFPIFGKNEEIEPYNPFGDKTFSERTSRTILGDALSKGKDELDQTKILTNLGEKLIAAGSDGMKFIDVLNNFSSGTEESKQALEELTGVLASGGPSAMKDFSSSMLKEIQALADNAKTKISSSIPGQPTKIPADYKDISKTMDINEILGTQVEDMPLKLWATSSMRQRAQGVDSRTAGMYATQELQQIASLNSASFEDVKTMAPEVANLAMQEVMKGQEERAKALEEAYGKNTVSDRIRSRNTPEAAQAYLTEALDVKNITENMFNKMPNVEVNVEPFKQAVTGLEEVLKQLETIKTIEVKLNDSDREILKGKGVQEVSTTNNQVLGIGDKIKQEIQNIDWKQAFSTLGPAILLTVGQVAAAIITRGRSLKTSTTVGTFAKIPNFAKTNIDKAINLEKNVTGKNAKFYNQPFPHVRNSSQPSFIGAMAQHGGLRKALQDSEKLQNSVQNFAIEPGTEQYYSLERLAKENTPEGRAAKAKLNSINKKYKGNISGRTPLLKGSSTFEKMAANQSNKLSTFEKMAANQSNSIPKTTTIFPTEGSYSGSPGNASPISKQLPKIPGPLTKLGKGLGPAASALLAAPQYQEYKNQGYDSLDAGLLTAGSFIGGTLGGALGGAAGTAVAPGIGTVGGAIGGAIGGSLLAEGMMKALIDDQKIKPKINPKNYKDSRKPSKPKAKGGTLMIDPGDGSTETTVGDTAKNFRPQSDMFQFPMQSFNFNKENIPEIKAKKPGKLEKYAAYAEELKNPKTFEDVKEKLPNGRIITRNRSVDIANDVANIQAAEGYRTKDERINERRRTGIEDSGFDKAYLQWEQVLDPSQPNGIGWRQVPEPKVLSRNYNSETGMISNSLSDGSSIGLESEVRQKEKDIYLKQTSKRYAEQARDKRLKSAQIGEAKPNLPGQASNIPMYKEGTDTNLTKEDMAAGDKMAKDLMNAALNQKGKDKYNRTGFQNLQASNRMYAPDIPAPKMEWEQTKDGKNVSKIVAKEGSVTPPSFMNENAALPVAPETLLGDKMFRSQQKFLDPSKSLMSLVPGENELDSPVAGVGNLGANARNYGKIGNPPFGGSTVGPYGSAGWDPRGSFDISDRYLGAASKNIPQGNLPFKNFTDYSYGQNAQQPKTALENQIAASQTSPLSMTPMAGVEGKRNEFTETNLKNNIGLPESNMITDYLQPQNSFKTQSLQGRDVVPRLGALNKATQSPLQNLGMGQTQSPLHTPLNDDSGTQAAMGILDPGFGAENRAASAERFNAARNFALNPTSIGKNLPIGTALPNTNNMFNTDNSIGGSIKDKMSQAINTPSPMQPLLSSSPNLSPNKNQTNINSLDSNMTYRDKKSGFLVSPTQEELGGNKLNMQSQPKDKSLEGADSLNQQLSTITENFSKLSEITKTFSETLNESNKKIQESSKSTESNQNQGTEQNQKDSKSQTVKVEPVTASVSVQTSPNTETEAKIAAIEAVIKELRSQLEGVKQKVTGNVDPPKK